MCIDLYEVVRQPGQKQIERVTISREPDGQSPHLAIAQEIAEHGDLAALRRAFRRGSACADVFTLVRAQPRMMAGIAVDDYEGEEIQEAQRARDAKPPAPAEMHHRQRDQRYADHIGEFCRGIEDRCRKCPFLTREPVAGCLRTCRKAWRLGGAQQDARAKDSCRIRRRKQSRWKRATKKTC